MTVLSISLAQQVWKFYLSNDTGLVYQKCLKSINQSITDTQVSIKYPKAYFGNTRSQLETRFKECCSHLKHNRVLKSAVASHALEEQHLDVTIDNLSLVKRINNKFELNAWESIFIHKNKDQMMNLDSSPIISPLFNLLN